jgi:hypothetical protein
MSEGTCIEHEKRSCRRCRPVKARSREVWVAQIQEEAPECLCCGGELLLMGVLGDDAHFRCRRCGADQSEVVK